MSKTNASTLVPFPTVRGLIKHVTQTPDFGPLVTAPDGVQRVKVVDNTTFIIQGTVFLPRMWLLKVATPGVFSTVLFLGLNNATLLVDGDEIPHIWGRDISSLVFQRLTIVDFAGGGIGQGGGRSSVLCDLVGGNPTLSFLISTLATTAGFKREGNLVDMGLTLGTQTQDAANAGGWVARCNAGQCLGHAFTGNGFGGLSFVTDNQLPSVSLLGEIQSASFVGCAVQLAKPGNAFLHIDSGSSGSVSGVGNPYTGAAAGEFFRSDEIEAITAQSDASIAITSFVDSTANPGVDTTVTFGAIVDFTRGQIVLIKDEAAYNGLHPIVRVADDQQSFDINVTHSTSDAGTLAMVEHAVASCKFVRDETVVITASTNYNETRQILRRTDTSFTLPQSFAGDDAAGDDGAGTATSTGKTEDSTGVFMTANGAQADSKRVGEAFWNANVASTTTADGSYSVLNLTGFTLSANSQRFDLSVAATGEITYVGEAPTTVLLRLTARGSTGPSTAREYRLTTSVDQATPAFGAVPYSTLDIAATAERVELKAIIKLNPGQDIRIMVAAVGHTEAITLSEGQLILQG